MQLITFIIFAVVASKLLVLYIAADTVTACTATVNVNLPTGVLICARKRNQESHHHLHDHRCRRSLAIINAKLFPNIDGHTCCSRCSERGAGLCGAKRPKLRVTRQIACATQLSSGLPAAKLIGSA